MARSTPLCCCLLVCVLTHCKVYDPASLAHVGSAAEGVSGSDDTDGGVLCGNGQIDPGETCDVALGRGAVGACPRSCEAKSKCQKAVLSGAGCQRRCERFTIAEAVSGDGCCPSEVRPGEDSDCGRCGDGVVSAGETCDPPSKCPTPDTCAGVASSCIHTRYSGSPASCTARCEVVSGEITACQDGDKCCPSMCNRQTDNDCSQRCGNGVVDADAGETCEPGRGCEVDCDDDDPCTMDRSLGSELNCDMRCVHLPITLPVGGDGCCPRDATAATDSDCRPQCGNGIRETGEQCDGEQDCDRRCQLTTSPTCRGPSTRDACRRCSCVRCGTSAQQCSASGERERDAQCVAVLTCALGNACVGDCTGDLGCLGRDCWFGSGYPRTPAGPCVKPIQTAAGGDPANVYDASHSTMFALYYAEQYLTCLNQMCATDCGL